MQDVLSTIPMFRSLDDIALKNLSSHTVTRSFPKNAIIITDGDKSDSLYIIQSGKVKVFLMNDSGKEVILNFQGSGEYFGEMALLDNEPRSASIMTLEVSKFAIISKNDFLACLRKHPEIALEIIKNQSRRLRQLTENVKSLALMDVYGRVARTLLSMAEPQNGKLVVTERLTQQDLANLVGSSREMVTRIFKELVTGGYIEVNKKQITINEKLPSAW